MSMGLTPRQRDLLDWLRAESGRCDASFAEMMEGLGCASTSVVARLLNGLEERGYVRRLRGRARSLELLTPPPPIGLRLRLVAGHSHWDRRAAENPRAWRMRAA